MTRRLLNLLTALSLLLCAGSVGLWVRSYRVADRLSYAQPDAANARWSGGSAFTTRGLVGVTWGVVEFTAAEYARQWIASTPTAAQRWSHTASPPYSYYQGAAPSLWRGLGLGLTSGDGGRSHVEVVRHHSTVTCPLALPAVVGAVVPAVWLARRHKARRHMGRGHCPTCGYNLTGNVSGVCPECGLEARC